VASSIGFEFMLRISFLQYERLIVYCTLHAENGDQGVPDMNDGDEREDK
jgi:hypothetical protein